MGASAALLQVAAPDPARLPVPEILQALAPFEREEEQEEREDQRGEAEDARREVDREPEVEQDRRDEADVTGAAAVEEDRMENSKISEPTAAACSAQVAVGTIPPK